MKNWLEKIYLESYHRVRITLSTLIAPRGTMTARGPGPGSTTGRTYSNARPLLEATCDLDSSDKPATWPRTNQREREWAPQPGALRLHWHWQPGPLRSFYYSRSTFSVFSVASLVRPGMLALRSVFLKKGTGKYYLKLLSGTKPGTSKP